MFSFFTYTMSRVTHSEPGLPMNKTRVWDTAFFGQVLSLRHQITWKIEAGHYGFHVVLFRKYVVF